MSRPRITVITPNLNQAAYLERTICSVLDQGYENLEYMVVDGGSTDESLSILRSYEPELAWWCSHTNTGPAQAINLALARATGNLVMILSADNLLLPQTLDYVADMMSGPSAPQWVVGQGINIGPSDQMLGSLASSTPRSLLSFLQHNSGLLPLSATVLRRELIKNHGPFDEQMQRAFGYEYACRLLCMGIKPTIVHRPFCAHRIHARSQSATHPVRLGMEQIAAARRYGECLPLTQRYSLWATCDHRERIYALAEAEIQGQEARRFLWQHVMRRPWWLANDTFRRSLVFGVHQPVSVRAA